MSVKRDVIAEVQNVQEDEVNCANCFRCTKKESGEYICGFWHETLEDISAFCSFWLNERKGR